MKIKQIAQLTNLSIDTIRYYDKLGLLRSDMQRDDNNNRIFTQQDVVWLNDIECFKQAAMTLNEISVLVKLVNDQQYDLIQVFLKDKHDQTQIKLNNLKKSLDRIDKKIIYYKNKEKENG